MKLNKINNFKTGAHMKILEYGIVYKTKKSKIKQAMDVQDKIRKKTKGGKTLSEEIRYWRDKR